MSQLALVHVRTFVFIDVAVLGSNLLLDSPDRRIVFGLDRAHVTFYTTFSFLHLLNVALQIAHILIRRMCGRNASISQGPCLLLDVHLLLRCVNCACVPLCHRWPGALVIGSVPRRHGL